VELQRKIKQFVTSGKNQRSPCESRIQHRTKTPNTKITTKSEENGPKTDRMKHNVTPIRNERPRTTSCTKDKHRATIHDRSLSRNFAVDTSREELTKRHILKNAKGRNSETTTLSYIKKPMDEVYDMVFPIQYHSKEGIKVLSNNCSEDGKITREFSNGKIEICFPNGVKRESFPDGYTIVYFNNKDIKQTYPNGKIVYYFAQAKITQTTFPEGLQVFKFSNNQLEKHYIDGHKEIT